MKRILVSLFLLLSTMAAVPAHAAGTASVKLAWDPNPEDNIAGYIVQYGTAPKTYTSSVDVGNVTAYEVPGLPAGVLYYFAVIAYNKDGIRSDASDEVSEVVDGPWPADIISPESGSLISSPTTTFTWNAGRHVTAFWLDVGTSRGGYDIFSNYVGTSQSWTISRIPLTGGPIWVRLRSLIAGAYQVRDFEFDTVNAAAKIVSPAPGSVLTGTTQTFSWDAGVGVSFYWLDVGVTPGDYGIYSGFVGTTQSAIIKNLPVNGGPVWVRLRSYIDGKYRIVDTKFTAGTATPARMTSPSVGSTLTGSKQTFTWSPGVGASFYWVNMGRTQGGYELYSNYVGTSTSITLPVPIDGKAVWVRLMSYIGGAYQFVDHRFIATAPGPARMMTPAVGAVLDGSTQTFTWTEGIGASFYWVNIGSTQGGYEYYLNYVGNFRMLTVNTLPTDGRTVWVRLMSYISGSYQYVDHKYTAAIAAPSRLSTPLPDSVIARTQTFTWDAGIGVKFYWINVGTSQGGYEIFSNFVGTDHARTITGIPASSSGFIWVRLYSYINGAYQYFDYRFRAPTP